MAAAGREEERQQLLGYKVVDLSSAVTLPPQRLMPLASPCARSSCRALPPLPPLAPHQSKQCRRCSGCVNMLRSAQMRACSPPHT